MMIAGSIPNHTSICYNQTYNKERAMLSDQTIQKLNQLHQEQDSYEPSLDIADKLASKAIVMLVGATGQGKNRIMETVASLDERFKVTGNRTSRAPREDDDHSRYTYFQNTDEGLASVFQSIDQHQMVQYAVNPYSQYIYGSTIDDYPGEYNLKDVFSSAIKEFRRLGFRQATAITVISDPQVWLQRFEERYPKGHPERQARRDENIESFGWSLAQDHDHFWVKNIDGDPEVAAREVIAIALGQSQGDPSVRELAHASLDAAWSIVI
jgi:guanylate kinase